MWEPPTTHNHPIPQPPPRKSHFRIWQQYLLKYTIGARWLVWQNWWRLDLRCLILGPSSIPHGHPFPTLWRTEFYHHITSSYFSDSVWGLPFQFHMAVVCCLGDPSYSTLLTRDFKGDAWNVDDRQCWFGILQVSSLFLQTILKDQWKVSGDWQIRVMTDNLF